MSAKEMIGGCCVCSDETGSEDNPLVYCDGDGCTVAVHQACYGIQAVPQGPWFCKRCESTERVARVKCDLCPQRDGAVKTTDKLTWAHVICALYIPEVDFGDTATMEPIRIKHIPSDRFHKTCCMCIDAGRESKAATGACMQCNKTNCKNYFHVTCAQAEGFLCEEFQQSIEDGDGVHYCGYCEHHFNKIVKGGEKKYVKDKAGNKKLTYVVNRKEYPIIRPIPAFRPIPSSDPKSPLDSSSLSGKKIPSSKDHHRDSSTKSSSSKDHHRDKEKDHSSLNGVKKSSTISSSSSKDKSKDLSSKSSTSSSSSSFSSSSKKDPLLGSSSSLFKDKDREKETSSSTFLAKDKLDIGSRPFESKPPEGQFSLSSFINPNLKSKLEQRQREKEKELEKLTAEEKFDALFSKPRSDSASKNTPSSSSSSKSSLDKKDSASSDRSKSSTQARKQTSSTGSSINSEKDKSALSLTSSVLGSFGDRKAKESPSSSSGRRVSDSSTDSDFMVKKKSKVAVSSSSSSSDSDSDDERSRKKKKKESPVVKKKPSKLIVVGKSSKDKLDSSKTSKPGTSSAKSPSRSSEKTLNVNGSLSSPTKKPLGRPKKKQLAIAYPRTASKSPKSAACIDDDDDDDDDDEDIDVVSRKKDLGDKNKSKKVIKKTSPSTTSSSLKRKTHDKDDDEDVDTDDASSTMTDNQDERKSKRSKTLAVKSSPSSTNSAKNTSHRVLRKSSTEGPMTRTPSASPARSFASPNKSSPEKDGKDVSSSPTDSNLAKRNGFLPPSLIPITNRRASAGHSIDMAFAHPAPPTARSAAKNLVVRDSTEPPASSLEALLERQWAQGSQFILDQAQHYDIASLLSCLSQLRQDNERLEDRMRQLNSRREHLLAVNARLALPLNGSFAGSLNQVSGLSASQIASQHHNSFLPPPSHLPSVSSTLTSSSNILASSSSVSSLHLNHHLLSGAASSLPNSSTSSSSLPSSLSGLPSFHLVPRETPDFNRRPSHESNPASSTSHINMNGLGSGRSSGDRPHSGYGLSEMAFYAASVAAAAAGGSAVNHSGTGFSLSSSLRSTPSPSTNSSSSRASPFHLGSTNPLGLNLSAHANQVASSSTSSSHNNRR